MLVRAALNRTKKELKCIYVFRSCLYSFLHLLIAPEGIEIKTLLNNNSLGSIPS